MFENADVANHWLRFGLEDHAPERLLAAKRDPARYAEWLRWQAAAWADSEAFALMTGATTRGWSEQNAVERSRIEARPRWPALESPWSA